RSGSCRCLYHSRWKADRNAGLRRPARRVALGRAERSGSLRIVVLAATGETVLCKGTLQPCRVEWYKDRSLRSRSNYCEEQCVSRCLPMVWNQETKKLLSGGS